MKRFPRGAWSVTLLVAAAWVLLATGARAEAEAKGKSVGKGATRTLKGEVVDTGCYMGHEARGQKHKECAAKCIANGMPMGLLTEGGELYLITQNHDNLDAYNQCKDLAAQFVEITGPVFSRHGMKSVQADAVKPVAAPAAK